MKKAYKVLFAAQDPGGFNAIFPVIKKMQKGHDLLILLANESRTIAKAKRISFMDCSSMRGDKLAAIFREFRPQVVIAATSMGLSLEKRVFEVARSLGVPVLSVIDFWSNYEMRFSNSGSSDLAYMPEAICITDAFMKKQMLGKGFGRQRLYVTGNPFFDTFKKFAAERRLTNHRRYILFISQPFSEDHTRFASGGSKLIFDEKIVFADIIKALSSTKIKLPILVALHPRDANRNKYDAVITGSGRKISIAKKEVSALISNAEYVIGMNSMVLLQAAMIGKRVISYQPGLARGKDTLITNRLGLSLSAFSYGSLVKKLKLAKNLRLGSKSDKIRAQYLSGHSAGNVVRLADKLSLKVQ